jgi:hypothetical protein
MPLDSVTPLEELLSRSKTFRILKGRGPLNIFIKSSDILNISEYLVIDQLLV